MERQDGGEVRASLREKAPAEFQVPLSHLDLYCSCPGISQGLPDTAQGCCNSLWSPEIKSKRHIQWKIPHSQLFYFICSRSGADENTLVSTTDRKWTKVFSCGVLFCCIDSRQEGQAHKWTSSSHLSWLKGTLHISTSIQRTLTRLLIDFFPLCVQEKVAYIWGAAV